MKNLIRFLRNNFRCSLINIIADGIAQLNKLQITHRDIKPNNILLQILPNGEHVYKLTEFGAAQQVITFYLPCDMNQPLMPDIDLSSIGVIISCCHW